MQVVEVLIEYSVHSLNRPFSYIYKGNKPVEAGYRVIINFHNKEIVGYVTKVTKTDKSKEELEDEYGFTFEEIKDVLDDAPLLNEDLLKLADQISEYYLAPKISVLQAMLPPSLSPRRSTLHAPKIAYDQYVKALKYDEEGLTSKQKEVLNLIKDRGMILKNELSPSIVNKLLEYERIEIVKKEKRRFSIPDYQYKEPPALTNEQKETIKEFDNSNDLVYLLEGITGSGKTEVYLTLSEEVLNKDKSVLMLVPEISLTPMMMEYFIRRFKDKVAILHSELTPAEKYDEYRKIARGECRIVIGARSAIFAPLHNIGLIILDEEHTESYKQDVSPYYHAREVAIMRAKTHKAKVLLGSATPSLESRARAQNGIYHLLKMRHRINEQDLPRTEIVDLSDYKNIDRDSFIFSKQMRSALQDVLSRHEQAILLINRRGFSTSVTCRKCGHVFKCPECGIPLTYHKSDNTLKCHHCNHVENMPDICPECGSKYLMKTGFGTERIEEEVHKLFPNARTLRLDSDSAKIRNKVPSIVESFRRKEADILIGTQMIAKGHDFPDCTFVGVVSADIGLTIPSYRNSERTFQLITQAVGRAGRSDKKGFAIIQTYMPDNYAIVHGAKQNFDLFYAQEMAMRKVQNYPPYAYLASITIQGKNEEKVEDQANDIVGYLTSQFGKEGKVIGPSTPFISKNKENYLKTVLIKYKNVEKTQEILNKLIRIFAFESSVSLSINIDPYNF